MIKKQNLIFQQRIAMKIIKIEEIFHYLIKKEKEKETSKKTKIKTFINSSY